jgi:hypothetical protein
MPRSPKGAAAAARQRSLAAFLSHTDAAFHSFSQEELTSFRIELLRW